MDPQFRRLFNEQFTPALYERYQRDLSERLNCKFEFRLAEIGIAKGFSGGAHFRLSR